MSDASQGPGWWLASDGKWYPPETWTGPPLPTAMPTAMPAGSPLPQATGGLAGQGPMPGYQAFPGAGAPMSAPTNGMAVASLVCACAGIIPFLFGIPAILGVIFGFVARGQIRRTNGVQGGGLALAGIIVGFSLIALFIVGVALIVAFANSTTCSTFNNNLNCTSN
jgi:hypothetical protein